MKANSLMKHIQIRHRSVDLYRCTTSTCLRSFQSFRSFKNNFQNKNNHPDYAVPLQGHSQSSNYDSSIFESINNESASSNDVNNDSSLLNESVENLSHELKDQDQEYKLSSTELRQDVTDAALSLVSKLYSSSLMTGSGVQAVVEGFSEFMGGESMSVLRTKVLEILRTNNVPIDDMLRVQSYFEAILIPFEGLESDYLRLQALKQTDMYVEPKPYIIGSVESTDLYIFLFSFFC